MLDTSRIIETPEGVELQVRIAGPMVRAIAWLLDTIIQFICYFFLATFLGILGLSGVGFFYISIFILIWFYKILFEVFYHGATPGKKAMGIHVLNANGTPVSWSSSVIRNLLRAVDFFPLFYGFGLISMYLSRDGQRLGDHAADTIVVYNSEKTELHDIPNVEPEQPPIPLQLEEQQAIIGFAERHEQLTEERNQELALILDKLIAGQSKSKLYQYANWLIGKR